MAQIRMQNVSFHFDTDGEDLFQQLSLQLDTDWKLGLVGRNGRGKTTFLKLLMGAYEYAGCITSPVTFEYFPLQVEDCTQLAREVVREVIAPFKHWQQQMTYASQSEDTLALYGEVLECFNTYNGFIIDTLIEKELRYMALDVSILSRPFDALSGGEQTRLLLIALFLRPNHFLLLDEPTNHLDSNGRECVARYLSKKKGFIVVSHDRAFLDRVVDHILSINKATITLEQGNFSSWAQNKKRQDMFEQSQNDKLKKEIKRLTDTATQKVGWANQLEASKIGSGVANRGYIGHKAAKMMKRAKCIEARQHKALIAKSKLLKDVEVIERLQLKSRDCPDDDVLMIQDLCIQYGARNLFQPLTFKISKGERVWLRGRNGCGKSSILKVLMGETIFYKGHIAKPARIAYITQDTAFLQGMLCVFVATHHIDSVQLKTCLHQLGVESSQFEKPIETWSQGQQKKLLIAKSLVEEAVLYIWDEPLNFIDVISVMQLQELILREQPTMLFVEHDTTFANTIATKVVDVIPTL